MKNIYNKGFSLIELLVVIAILVLIVAVAMPKLIDFQRAQSLKNTTENIVALLNKAQSDSYSSLNSSNYGVHFESDRMVYFIGSIYSEGKLSNVIVDFESGVEIPDDGGINLDGGGSDIIFPRLRDNIIGYGIITIGLTSDPSRQKVITINKSGSISSS